MAALISCKECKKTIQHRRQVLPPLWRQEILGFQNTMDHSHAYGAVYPGLPR